MNKSVYLSPSTQENNVGVADYGTEEDRMQSVCDFVQEELLRHGITVFRNRPDMTLKQVVEDSNRKDPTIHFAIHSNAHTGKARGGEVFCHRFGGEGERLARLVYAELEPLTPTKDRGVKEGLNHFGMGKPLYELAQKTHQLRLWRLPSTITRRMRSGSLPTLNPSELLWPREF